MKRNIKNDFLQAAVLPFGTNMTMNNSAGSTDTQYSFFMKGNKSKGGFQRKILCMIVLCATAFVVLNNVFDMNKDQNRGENMATLRTPTTKKHMNIVGFWHIGQNYQPSEETRDDFAVKQGTEIMSSYLFTDGLETGDYNLSLHYMTQVKLSDDTKKFLGQTGLIHEGNYTAMDLEEGVEYYEYPTLVQLHDYCLDPEHEDDIVFYLHSKTRDSPRQSFENVLFGDTCVQCMQDESKLACGPNFTGTHGWFWSHFSGNFWMTRCSHIKKLNKPFDPKFLEEEATDGLDSQQESAYSPPLGRLFAEYWMMNDVGERPESKRAMVIPGHIKGSQTCSDKYRFYEPEDEEESTK